MRKDVFGYIAMFSLVLMILSIFSILIWGVNNDYVLYYAYNASEQIHQKGFISDQIMDTIASVGETHAGMVVYFDWWFAGAYILFFFSLIMMSYFLPEDSEIGFLTMLFYGTMVVLFVITIIDVVTKWLATDILYQLVPNLQGSFHKFDFIVENNGFLSFILMMICLFANKIDLKLFRRKGQKIDARISGEVL